MTCKHFTSSGGVELTVANDDLGSLVEGLIHDSSSEVIREQDGALCCAGCGRRERGRLTNEYWL